MVGLGYWGPNLLRNFDQLSNCGVKICCDLDARRLASVKGQYPYLMVTDNYNDLLNDPDLDAIVIATRRARITLLPLKPFNTVSISSLKNR